MHYAICENPHELEFRMLLYFIMKTSGEKDIYKLNNIGSYLPFANLTVDVDKPHGITGAIKNHSMATSTTFISNTSETHRDYLLNLLEQSDKIIFAVGFLKQSGLNIFKAYLKEFCADKTKSSTFYIGTGLGETDPDTLQSLYNIIKTKTNHQLVLCTPDAGIFHPKIYVFITGRKVTIVTGSSNLTQHGWAVNDEVSMVVETTINSRSIFNWINTSSSCINHTSQSMLKH